MGFKTRTFYLPLGGVILTSVWIDEPGGTASRDISILTAVSVRASSAVLNSSGSA